MVYRLLQIAINRIRRWIFTPVSTIIFSCLWLAFLSPTFGQHLQRDTGTMWLVKDFADSSSVSHRDFTFQLAAGTFYRADQPTLHRSAVKIKVGQNTGGTGAIISDEGLILTSHFVALQALSRLSTPKRNLIQNGFSAARQNQEIPLHNYQILVPLSQQDVTTWITSRIPDDIGYRDSLQRQKKLRKQLIQKYRESNPDLHLDIKEIYGGNRQLLTTYRRINDVRLVQVPPEKIGQYRGPESYHQWPRFSGGYALLRGYVSPDGTSRPYNQSNVAWQPEKSLDIDPAGLQANQPYIALGYPGSTYRLQSSFAYRYYRTDLNPYIEKTLENIIGGLEQAASSNPSIALNNRWKRSNLQRSLNYYQGVEWGFREYDIIRQKKQLEHQFREWIERDSLRELRYGRVLTELEKSFRIAGQNSPILYTGLFAINHNKVLQLARMYHSYFEYARHPDSLSFSPRQRQGTLHRHRQIIGNADMDAQTKMLADLLVNFYELPERNQLPFLYVAFNTESREDFRSSVKSFLKRQRTKSVVYDTARGRQLLNMKPIRVQQAGADSLLLLFESIYNGFKVGQTNHQQHLPYLRPARRYYIDGVHRMRSVTFQRPDANSTLRLSAGNLRGLGKTSSPYTTLSELIESGQNSNRNLPDFLKEWEQKMANKKTLPLKHSSVRLTGEDHELPITAVSMHDISDGSTGGPLISERGLLTGITLEPNFRGIVGDFYVVPATQRAINLDIRYILALIDHYDRTGNLMEEINLQK